MFFLIKNTVYVLHTKKSVTKYMFSRELCLNFKYEVFKALNKKRLDQVILLEETTIGNSNREREQLTHAILTNESKNLSA